MLLWTGSFAWKPADRALTLAVLAQSLGTLRCCSVVRDVILLADIFEEEDFYPNTYGFRLVPPVDDASLLDLLRLAEEAVREQVRSLCDISDTGHCKHLVVQQIIAASDVASAQDRPCSWPESKCSRTLLIGSRHGRACVKLRFTSVTKP